MQSATIHIRLFGLVYNNPKQGDIPCGIDVRIHIVPAIHALERLVFPDADVMATAASLRSIGWFNDNQLDTGKSAFVSQEGTELAEIPTVEFASESLVPALCGLSDMAKVLYGEAYASVLCLRNNLFGNGVVDYRCSGLLSPAKPFQEPLAASCAFGLDGTTDSQSLFPIRIENIGGIGLSFGSTNDICNSEVQADNGIRNIHLRFGNVDSLIQKEFSSLEYKVGFTFEMRNIHLVVADEWTLLSSAYCPQGCVSTLVGKDAGVIADASERAELSLFLSVELVRIGNLADTTDYHLGREVELLPHILITKVMYLEPTESLILPGDLRNVATSLVGFLYCSEKKQPLLIARKNFHFQRQFHAANVLKILCFIHFFKTKKRNAAQFRPLS